MKVFSSIFICLYALIVVAIAGQRHVKINKCLKDPKLKSRLQKDVVNVREFMKVDGLPTNVDKLLTSWSRPRLRTQLLMEETNSLYIRVYKCGNNQIALNLQQDHNAMRIHPENITRLQDKCAFTFVRDPVSRFSSGYNEIEFRMTERKDAFNTFFEKKKREGDEILFHSFPVGSQARVHVFFHELLEGKLIDLPDVSHLDPMVIFLKNLYVDLPPLQYVGLVDTLDEDYEEAQKTCGFKNITPLDHALGQHPTSADPLGAYDASKQFFSHPSSIKALCEMYATDYQCFGLPLPAECI